MISTCIGTAFHTMGCEEHIEFSSNESAFDSLSNNNHVETCNELNEAGSGNDETPEQRTNITVDDARQRGRKLIAIDGYWYDITMFIPHHPGGDIIKKFIGKDASAVFHAFHRAEILNLRRPLAICSSDEQIVDPIDQDFAKLGADLEKEGFFRTDYHWYALKFILAFLPLILCVIGVTQSTNSTVHYIAAIMLAAFWQQSGFFMHDFMHNQFSGRRLLDQRLGTFFGTICFGISGQWWRDEHFTHHAVTCNVDKNVGCVDPQMTEATWVQSRKLWKFYSTKLEYVLIKIQHITFLPICIIAGRCAIMVASMTFERRPREIIAFVLHCLWLSYLISLLPNAKERIIFYAIASVIEGILHVQLLISHYAKEYHDLDDLLMDTKSWYRMQVESNIDIINPMWLDWFHGGLNYHLVHHLYPRMPRHNYRAATKRVVALCQKHGLHYDSCTWSEAIWRTLKHLKVMGKHFTLDPR